MFWKQFALKWTAAQEQCGFRTQLECRHSGLLTPHTPL